MHKLCIIIIILCVVSYSVLLSPLPHHLLIMQLTLSHFQACPSMLLASVWHKQFLTTVHPNAILACMQQHAIRKLGVAPILIASIHASNHGIKDHDQNRCHAHLQRSLLIACTRAMLCLFSTTYNCQHAHQLQILPQHTYTETCM